MTVIDEIAAERQRQMDVEGWTTEHDDGHVNGEMADAASCYARCGADDHTFGAWKGFADNGQPPRSWPWDFTWWKPKDRRSCLIKAAALIVAEIERVDRLAGL